MGEEFFTHFFIEGLKRMIILPIEFIDGIYIHTNKKVIDLKSILKRTRKLGIDSRNVIEEWEKSNDEKILVEHKLRGEILQELKRKKISIPLIRIDDPGDMEIIRGIHAEHNRKVEELDFTRQMRDGPSSFGFLRELSEKRSEIDLEAIYKIRVYNYSLYPLYAPISMEDMIQMKLTL